MTLFRPLLGRAKAYFILFASFRVACALLQNVTVDDAVLTGAVIPKYLPSVSSWNQGNACPQCLAKPDPFQAYNGTWHDTTYKPRKDIYPAIQFTFTGSALYIFFILANTVRDADTLTDIVFHLDGVAVGTFVHSPSTSTDYEYNVPVYTNESMGFGEHTIVIDPVNSGNPVLILFDYLIYSMNVDNATTTALAPPSPSSSPSLTSPGFRGTSSKKNTGAIVGGTIGGVSALVLVAASLFCYRRYNRRKRPRRLSSREGAVLGSLISLEEPLRDATTQFHHQMRFAHHEPRLNTVQAPPAMLRPSSIAVSVDPPSTASISNDNAGLVAQVEQLRHEVSHLLFLHDQRQISVGAVPGKPSPRA